MSIPLPYLFLVMSIVHHVSFAIPRLINMDSLAVQKKVHAFPFFHRHLRHWSPAPVSGLLIGSERGGDSALTLSDRDSTDSV